MKSLAMSLYMIISIFVSGRAQIKER